jgi:hypothetical protein
MSEYLWHLTVTWTSGRPAMGDIELVIGIKVVEP